MSNAGNQDSGAGDPPTEPPARRPGDPPPPPPRSNGDADEPTARTPQSQAQGPRASVLRSPTISVEPATASASPDAPAEVVLAVTNRSDTVNEFLVELEDPTVGWIRIEPATRNIWPGSRDVFRIIIQPPRSADVRAGWRSYGLRIRSGGIPDGFATAELRVEVRPFEAVEARLIPRTSAGYTRGRHRIELRNQGSAPWTANVTGIDPEDVLRLKVPTQVMANPGETLNVPIVVRPRSLAWIGSKQRHPFSVALARQGGAAPITLEGTYTQRAFIPTFVIPAVVAAIVAAVALFATGILPPKPPPAATPQPTAVPSEAVVTDAPSVASLPPSEEPSAEASPSEEASASASLDPSTPPDGVAQWAWDRRNAQLAQGNPFDPGDPIGPTSLTNDSMAELQLWTNATMYRIVGSDAALTVRPPILAPFRETSGDPKAPTTGYPKDNRRNDGNNRFAQQFTLAGIACNGEDCHVLPSTYFDPWYERWTQQLGYPIGDVLIIANPDSPTNAPFEHGWVVNWPGLGVAVCDENRNLLEGPDQQICSNF